MGSMQQLALVMQDRMAAEQDVALEWRELLGGFRGAIVAKAASLPRRYFDDAVSELELALYRAVVAFDASKGSFSPYVFGAFRAALRNVGEGRGSTGAAGVRYSWGKEYSHTEDTTPIELDEAAAAALPAMDSVECSVLAKQVVMDVLAAIGPKRASMVLLAMTGEGLREIGVVCGMTAMGVHWHLQEVRRDPRVRQLLGLGMDEEERC